MTSYPRKQSATKSRTKIEDRIAARASAARVEQRVLDNKYDPMRADGAPDNKIDAMHILADA